MKVGTDAVLLGAWMPVPENCESILEIGCGCGVISLMLAQRTDAKITGIDIDEKSVIEAKKNAENAIFGESVQFIYENVLDFVQKTTQKFEVIVSNPPFFENSLKSPKANKNISKHNDHLSFEELIEVVDVLLAKNGCFGIILPLITAENFEKLAINHLLYATKKTYIYPTSTKKANRVLMTFEREPAICEESNLVIRDNGYTEEYLKLMREYLLIKN
jgi:tRNA1Val (adenine37-N6)-methyltransferase